MLPSIFVKGFDRRRLLTVLALIFVALAVPTGLLIWQAYSQLKWESFHQYRGMAEELTRRIDARLGDGVRSAEARSFADYSFLVVSGDANAGFFRPSDLSAYPVDEEIPGVIGPFQVASDGTFSTPLLPQAADQAEAYGIAPAELLQRQRLARELQDILVDNRLVRSRVTAVESGRLIVPNEIADRPGRMAPSAVSQFRSAVAEPELDEDAAAAAPGADADAGIYSQSVFDDLNRAAADAGAASPAEATERNREVAKVGDLRLDAELQKKSELLEQTRQRPAVQAPAQSVVRAKRVQQDLVPATGSGNGRISTFESEIDPFELSLLDSGHLVLFRNAWKNGERFVQGLLLDQRSFVDASLVSEFRNTALSQMSNVFVAYEDDVIRTAIGEPAGRYSDATELRGSLLYNARLSAPFDRLGLIFSVNRLPPGPGATVLAWVTVVLASVFVGGFYAMYRLGRDQIDLARQQQDFVSAVSHELKTPLTSIRMYGEMLKDGWADSDKRQQYYEYIHGESERLTRLISNVLQLASITRNEPRLEMQRVRVGTLFDQIRSKIGNQIERAHFELVVEADPDVSAAEIDVDEDCFAQIIINLVDNAIKFSTRADARRICIGASRNRAEQVVFSVRDFGPGIPREQMKKIFRLFYRSESELTRETVGTGIGLAIVHQLTTAMGGSIDVLNADPGAEFRLTFPAR